MDHRQDAAYAGGCCTYRMLMSLPGNEVPFQKIESPMPRWVQRSAYGCHMYQGLIRIDTSHEDDDVGRMRLPWGHPWETDAPAGRPASTTPAAPARGGRRTAQRTHESGRYTMASSCQLIAQARVRTPSLATEAADGEQGRRGRCRASKRESAAGRLSPPAALTCFGRV